MKKITVLGSTGSIGVNTLDVISHHLDQYEVFALSGNQQVETLIEQCLRFKPRYVVLCNDQAVARFREQTQNLSLPCELLAGSQALSDIAAHPEVDIVMAAIVGSAGLHSTLAALRAGKKVLLANKEALVMAGDLVLQTLATSGAQLIPVDSEHSAIFQCLPAAYLEGRLFTSLSPEPQNHHGVAKIVLTASGGATRDLPLKQLAEVSPAFACTHPNWSMGKKVTVDSATMMNKALEVIEAHYLFGLPCSQLEVLLHPQSIIHSMVYYADGSVLAQLGQPDMRTPIACALAWPARLSTKVAELDFTKTPVLTFEQLNHTRYPCLALGFSALQSGGLAATVLNAANEVAVDRFLKEQIRFTDIVRLNEAMLQIVNHQQPQTLEAIQALDLETRQRAAAWAR